MNSAFVDFVLNLVETRPETTVADVLDRIVLERLYITVEGQDAFSLDELAEIEWHWRILIRRFQWPPSKQLDSALHDAREPLRGDGDM